MDEKIIGTGTIIVKIPVELVGDDEKIVAWAQQRLGIDPNHPETPVNIDKEKEGE
jgi:hypothetical protein